MTETTSGNNLINTGALIRAGGIGAAIGVVLAIIRGGIGILTGAALTSSDFSSDAAGSALLGGGAVGICLCCVGVLVFGAVGAGYGWFVEKDGGALEIGPIALGGALSAFAAGIISGLCSAVMTGISTTMTMGSYADSSTLAASIGGAAAVAICAIPIGYAILGALGGLIYAAVKNNQNKPQPAAM